MVTTGVPRLGIRETLSRPEFIEELLDACDAEIYFHVKPFFSFYTVEDTYYQTINFKIDYSNSRDFNSIIDVITKCSNKLCLTGICHNKKCRSNYKYLKHNSIHCTKLFLNKLRNFSDSETGMILREKKIHST